MPRLRRRSGDVHSHRVLDNILPSLHDRRFMSQAGRTRYFARSTTRARSARRGKEKNKALFFSFPRLALRAGVALRAKYRVCPAWLIKRLSCRLYFTRFVTGSHDGMAFRCGQNHTDGKNMLNT